MTAAQCKKGQKESCKHYRHMLPRYDSFEEHDTQKPDPAKPSDLTQGKSDAYHANEITRVPHPSLSLCRVLKRYVCECPTNHSTTQPSLATHAILAPFLPLVVSLQRKSLPGDGNEHIRCTLCAGTCRVQEAVFLIKLTAPNLTFSDTTTCRERFTRIHVIAFISASPC